MDSLGSRPTDLGQVNISEFQAGDLIADRFEIVALLGQGGMGAVYQVDDRELGERCALKLLHPHLLSSDRAVERFVQEARLSRQLMHDGIVRVHDLGRVGEMRYLSMELLEGRSLRSWLQQLRIEGQLPPIETVRSIIGQVLDALEYAHRRTIHRDIKPENIFLLGDGPDYRTKLLDFGIAKALDREALTSTSSSMGTAWYVAPEQLEGAEEVDPRADLFSLGAVLYELLTGRVPHGVLATPSALREELDSEWDDLVFSALAAEREQRPASAAVMRTRLQGLNVRTSRIEPEEPAPPPPPEPAPPKQDPAPVHPSPPEMATAVPVRKKRGCLRAVGWIVAVAAILIVAAVIVSVGFYLKDRAWQAEQRRQAEALEEELRTADIEEPWQQPPVEEPDQPVWEPPEKEPEPPQKDSQVDETFVFMEEVVPGGKGEEFVPSDLDGKSAFESQDKGAIFEDNPFELPPAAQDQLSGGPPFGENPGDQLLMNLGNHQIAFRWIPAGEVRMGSPSQEVTRLPDETRWTARISQGFWLSETEVTQEFWEAIMGLNPSFCTNCVPTTPVEGITWFDAVMFLDKLSHHYGGFFRLPTEAEWERAARAGTSQPFSSPCRDFNEANAHGYAACLDGFAWYAGNSSSAPQPVGYKQPNPWGLFDMHGNIAELCGDYYGPYPGGRQIDYTGPDYGEGYVVRGGAWGDPPTVLRSARRSWIKPDARHQAVGLRMVWMP